MPQKPEIKTKYTIGEKVLCYHGPLLYEAKCMEIQEGVETRYLIHYQGWNKTWDEWVNDTRILKFNEAGIKKQKELQDQYRESRKKKDGKKKLLPDKKKQNRNPSDKQRFIGSASETSNRSFGESEDGKTSKFTTEDDNLEIRTEAGTSVMSGEDLDDQRSIINRDKSIGSSSKGGSRSKKRRLSNSETTGGERIDEKTLIEEEINYPTNNNINNNSNNGNNNNNNEATNSNRSTNSSKSKKSRLVPLDESVVDLEAYVTGINCQTLKFVFSDNLRMWLADDWDLITRQSRLTRIPTRMSVDNVLTKYREYCEQLTLEDGENENLFSKNREMRFEFVEGLRKYFNTAVGSQLLYKFERQQYFEIVNGSNDLKLEMSSVYGSMYVLRLLVSLNKLISYTRTDTASTDCLSELIQHFIEYLDSNADDFFKLEDYITATADYTRRAMC